MPDTFDRLKQALAVVNDGWMVDATPTATAIERELGALLPPLGTQFIIIWFSAGSRASC